MTAKVGRPGSLAPVLDAVLMALRDVTEDDLEIFFEHQRDPDATAMAAFTAREHDAFMTHWRTNLLACAEVTKKTIVVDGEVAGNIVSWRKDGKRLLGYWIGRAYWGRGVATRALAELVSAHLTERPLHAYVATRNLGSIKVLEKCGFRRVGEPETGPDGVEEILMELW